MQTREQIKQDIETYNHYYYISLHPRLKISKLVDEDKIIEACEELGDQYLDKRPSQSQYHAIYWYQRSAEQGNTRILKKLKKEIDYWAVDKTNTLNPENVKSARIALIHAALLKCKQKPTASCIQLIIEQLRKLDDYPQRADHLNQLAQAYAALPRSLLSYISATYVGYLCELFKEKNNRDAILLFGSMLTFHEGNQQSQLTAKTRLENYIADTKEAKSDEFKALDLARMLLTDARAYDFVQTQNPVLSYNLLQHFREVMHFTAQNEKEYKLHTQNINTLLIKKIGLSAPQQQRYIHAAKAFYSTKYVEAGNDFQALATEIERLSAPSAKLYAAHCYLNAGDAFSAVTREKAVALHSAGNAYFAGYMLLHTHKVETTAAAQALTRIAGSVAEAYHPEYYALYLTQLVKALEQESRTKDETNLDHFAAAFHVLATPKLQEQNPQVWLKTLDAIADIAIQSKKSQIRIWATILFNSITPVPTLQTKFYDRLADCYAVMGETHTIGMLQNREKACMTESKNEALQTKFIESMVQAGDCYSQDTKKLAAAEKFYRRAYENKDIRGLIGIAKIKRLQDQPVNAAKDLCMALDHITNSPTVPGVERALNEAEHLARQLVRGEDSHIKLNSAIQNLYREEKVSPYRQMLHNKLKLWLKTNINWLDLTPIAAQAVKANHQDLELLELAGNHFVKARHYDLAIQCFLKIINAQGTSLAKKQELINQLPAHIQSHPELSKRAREIKFVMENRTAAILKDSHEHYGTNKPSQIYFDGIEERLNKHGTVKTFYTMTVLQRNQFFSDLAAAFQIKNPLATHVYDQLKKLWQQDDDTLVANALLFQLTIEIPQIDENFQIEQRKKLLILLHHAGKDAEARIKPILTNAEPNSSVYEYLLSHLKANPDQAFNTIIANEEAFAATKKTREVATVELTNLAKKDNLCAVYYLAQMYQDKHPESALYLYLKILVMTKNTARAADISQVLLSDIHAMNDEALRYLVKNKSNSPLAAWGLGFVGTPAKEEKVAIVEKIQTQQPELFVDQIITAGLRSQTFNRADLLAAVQADKLVYFPEVWAGINLDAVAKQMDAMAPAFKPDVRASFCLFGKETQFQEKKEMEKLRL